MKMLYNQLTQKIERYLRIDAHYFLSGGFWLSLGQAITILFGLITTALLANYLNETDYGIYKYLLALATIFSVFSLTGISQSILQTAAKGHRNFYRENLPLIFKYNLLISLSAASGAIYYFANENFTLAIGCAAIAVLQPITNTFQHVVSQLQGEQRFKITSKISVIRTIFVSMITIVTLFLTKNILWLLLAYLSSQLFINLITHLLYSKKSAPTPADITRKYLHYAKHTSLRNLIEGVAYKADALIIFTRLGAVELAVYSIAIIIPEQVKGSLKNLSALLMPKYAKLSDPNILLKTLPYRSFQLLAILTVVSLVYILTIPFVYSTIFPKYPDAILYSQLIALSFPSFVTILAHNLLKAQLAERELYKINTYGAILQLLSVSIGVYFYGVLGIIIATIFKRYVMTFMFFYYIKSKFNR